MEELDLSRNASRETIYRELLPQIVALTDSESDRIANLANVCAALKEALEFFWVGFYLEKNGELVLGPFQGPIACTRLEIGKGVCGTAFEQEDTIIVADVDKYPGHIACSSRSRSEIVIPLKNNKSEVIGVLDVDSDTLNDFTKIDSLGLGRIVDSISV